MSKNVVAKMHLIALAKMMSTKEQKISKSNMKIIGLDIMKIENFENSSAGKSCLASSIVLTR